MVSAYKFGQAEVKATMFNTTYELTDIYSINLNKIRVSNIIECGKHDAKYIVGYEKEPCNIIPLHIKTPKKCYSNGVSRYNEKSSWKMGFNVSEDDEWVKKYVAIWAKVEELIFECFQGEVVRNGQYINPKLIVWNGEICTRFNGEKIGYESELDRRMLTGGSLEVTGILKISHVYRQGSNYHHQVVLKECKYAKKKRVFESLLSDDEEGFDTVW